MAIFRSRAINSAARVPPLQGGSQGFESLIAHYRGFKCSATLPYFLIVNVTLCGSGSPVIVK